MMSTEEKLEALRRAAYQDNILRERLLDTESEQDALHAFCRIATEYGIPLTAMEMITSGEEAYAAMKRSTNGGGENSPLLAWEDDVYEMFIADLKRS